LGRRIALQLLALAALCATGLYALRVWRVSAGSLVASRTLVASAVAAALVITYMAATVRRRRPDFGSIIVVAGSLLIAFAAAAEYQVGLATIACMAPDESAEIGSLKIKFDGFEASFQDEGELAEFRSNLVVDAGSGPKDLTAVSGRPLIFHDYHICQLEFDLRGVPGDEEVRTHLGILAQRAGAPFFGGIAVLGVGTIVSLLSWRRG
jgi:hypothetical protein